MKRESHTPGYTPLCTHLSYTRVYTVAHTPRYHPGIHRCAHPEVPTRVIHTVHTLRYQPGLYTTVTPCIPMVYTTLTLRYTHGVHYAHPEVYLVYASLYALCRWYPSCMPPYYASLLCLPTVPCCRCTVLSTVMRGMRRREGSREPSFTRFTVGHSSRLFSSPVSLLGIVLASSHHPFHCWALFSASFFPPVSLLGSLLSLFPPPVSLLG